MEKYARNDNDDGDNHDRINKRIYESSMLSGKIHDSLEDPFSQFCYDVSDSLSPTLYNMGISPNLITVVRFFMIIVAFVFFFENREYKITAILTILAYFMDCLDGHLARKYNLDSELGDYLDHVADTVTFIILFYYIHNNIASEYNWLYVLIFISLFISLIHVSCEERYLDALSMHRKSPTLSVIDCLCPQSLINDKDIEEVMELTKFTGLGVWIVFITIFLWNFHVFEKK